VNPQDESERVARAVADEQHLFVTTRKPNGTRFIVCMDLGTGQEVWRTPRNHLGDLAISGNHLFVADNDEAAAVACADGRVIWQRGSEWTYLRGLAADTARVYVVCKTITEKGGRKSDEVVVAALHGGNGRTLWTAKPFPEGAHGEPTFAMRAEIMLVGSETPTPKGTGSETRISVLGTRDGLVLWQERLPWVRFFPWGLVGARSLTTIGGITLPANGTWVQMAATCVGEESYEFILLHDFTTRRFIWRKLAWRGDWVSQGEQMGLATDGARLFVHRDYDGEVRCLDLNTGSRLWEVQLDKKTQRVSHPVVSGKTVLALAGSGYLHGIESTSGRSLWRICLGREIREPKSQVLVSGQYVVVCDESTVWVFRPRGQ
jgi:outer membrane protein assembly factor BamB